MQAQEEKQELEGSYTLEDFQKTQHNEWYEKYNSNYTPDKATLKKLNKVYNGQTAVAFLGSWCSDTQKHWSAFMKVWEEISSEENIQLYFVGLDKAINEPEFQKFEIEYVPTIFILDSNGKVIGKFVETPEKSVEEDLLGILND